VPAASRFALVAAAWLASAGAFADGLRFSFEPLADQGARALWLKGEIAPGDLGRLRSYLKRHADAFAEHGDRVAFAIDGGDVEEAMRLGEFLRESMMEAHLPDAYRARCASACFFLLAGAVSRHAGPDTVSIHRPHFDATDLARARASAARNRYDALFAGVRAYLDRMQVPRVLTETLLATPGSQTYRLTRADLDLLGTTQAWFEDYAAARCDVEPGLARRLASADGEEARALRDEMDRMAPCVSDLRRRQRLRVIADPDSADEPG
jgi:hypothetical protein